MRGYLLDVNHIEAHFRKHPPFMERYRLVPHDAQWRICSTTLGEIEAGHEMSSSTNQQRRDDYAAFIIEEYLHNALDVTASTRGYYASIVGRIWKKHPPSASKDTRTERHLVDLGIDVNDVWLVSAAWEHGLTVLTRDAMSCIREAVGSDVQFDCWI